MRNYHAVMGAPGPSGPRAVSIGPITSATMRELGITVDAEAAEHTIPGLVDALLARAASGDAAGV